MPSNTPAKPSSTSPARSFWLAVALLAAIASVLFFQSFLPGKIVFSNDGPYGAIKSDAGRLPGGFKGVWQDLTWLGSEGVSASPDLSNLLALVLRPLGFAKFYPVISVFVLGLCASVFLCRLGFTRFACIVAGIAAMLNSDFFSTACWGLASQPICFGAGYLALAAITTTPSARHPWLRAVLAGLCVGWGIMEAFDIGAIFSLFVAAYVLYQAWNTDDRQSLLGKLGAGALRLAIVAISAGIIAANTINVLVNTQIKGVTGTAQDKATREAHWPVATQWSVPKVEILQVFIPGIFGYRTDTPGGGNYWGSIGQDSRVPEYIKLRDSGPDEQTRAQAARFLEHRWRFSGTGYYAGILVLVVASWAVMQSFRKQGSPFSRVQRRWIWFWLALAVPGVLLSFGKYAPFYRFFYALPYSSTIRDPTKFLHIFSWALIVVFGYGLDGLHRTYMRDIATRSRSLFHWDRVSRFDGLWFKGLLMTLGLAVLGWMIYASSRDDLESHLRRVGFDDVKVAHAIAGFGLASVGWFVLLLALSAALMALVLTGRFAGPRAKTGGILLGLLVLFDLGRADLPWIIFWDVNYKYASDPILDRLRDKPYEHRVSMIPYGAPSQQLEAFGGLYGTEWTQHLFELYNIQSLDVIQEPRVGIDKATFLTALDFPKTPFSVFRIWELTNTRYLLWLGDGYVDALNRRLDPEKKRFHVIESFSVTNKPGATGSAAVDHHTVPNPAGELALIEFTGALPRASLYSNWQVSTNDDLTLTNLASPAFDPRQIVLVSDPIPAPLPANTNQPAGAVQIKPNYKPKRVELDADVKTPAVLLLTDRFNVHWHVTVDGHPAPMLRCDYILRGVYLQPGQHDIVFTYQVPLTTLYISVAAVFFGLGLCAWLAIDKPAPEEPAARAESAKT